MNNCKSILIWATLFLCALFLVTPCSSRSLFVDSEWLVTHQDTLVILDARPYRNYFWSHIPGALSAPWKDFSEQEMKMDEKGWGLLLPEKLLAQKLGALGLHRDSQVVVYGDYPGWGDDGRVVWTLMMMGMENVYILNGGLDAWEEADGDTTMKKSEAKRTVFSPKWNEDLISDIADITDHDNAVLIDTRTEEEFAGDVQFGEARGGHIPGAIHIPFTRLFKEDGTIRESKDLEQLFEGHRISKDDTIIPYCTAGIRSAHMVLVLKSLGYSSVKNYDAGFYEWARRTDLPLNRN